MYIVGVGLCLCAGAIIIGLCAWSMHQKALGSSTGQKKYAPWSERVAIDPHRPYQVIEVVDGDTLKASIDSHTITIRLLGINTPEVLDPRKGIECYGPEASAETKSLLTGQSVFAELNPNYDRSDKYGRLLAYIRRASDDLSVNEYLVKEGYAREYTFDEKKPYEYQSLFRSDQLEAQKAGKGLWGKCGT